MKLVLCGATVVVLANLMYNEKVLRGPIFAVFNQLIVNNP